MTIEPDGTATPGEDAIARTLLEHVGAAVMVTDGARRVLHWNREAERLLGWSAAEAEGRPLVELAGAGVEDVPAPQALDGRPWEGDVTLLTRAGGERALHLRAAVMRGAAGTPVGAVLVAGEAGARLRAEQFAGMIQALFAEAPVGLAVVDTGLRFVAANPALEAISGSARGGLTGRSVRAVLAHGQDAVEAVLRQVLDTGEPMVNLEVSAHTADGVPVEHTWLVSYVRLDGPDGDPVGVGIMVVDISERTRAERAASAAGARLELLARASRVLGASLDIEDTLQALMDLTVPTFSTYGVLDLLDEPVGGSGRLRRRAFAGRQPGRPYPTWSQPGQTLQYPPAHPARRVLAEGRSVFMPELTGEDIDATAPTPEIATKARALGLRSLLSVALKGPTRTLGTATFTRVEGERPFDADDLALAEQLAVRAAVAIEHAELFTAQRQIALTLQRSLLPTQPPDVEGLEVAWRYLPGTAGTEVGGDWFDLVPLPVGRVGIVIGDVMGRGVTAAAVMGQLRAAARAYAVLDLPPDEVLARLDDLVHGLDGPEPGRLVTCVYGIYDPGARRCCLANAGHLPPVVATGGRTTLVTEASAVPLGVGGVPFTSHEIELAPGALLALFTDGVVEHRGRDLDAGIGELRSRLAALAGGELDAACDELLDGLRPAGDFDDDAALLLLRVPTAHDACIEELHLTPEPRSAAEARSFTAETLRGWGLGELADPIVLLVSELVANAVSHSDGAVELRLRRARTAIYAEVADGDTRVPRLRTVGAGDESGRGLHLVDQLVAVAGQGRPGRWGARPLAAGKVVWVEVPLAPGSCRAGA